MKLKRLNIIFVACSFLLQVPVFASEAQLENNNNIGIYINGGKKLDYKNSCYIKNGVVYLPLRDMVEKEDGLIEYHKPNVVVTLGSSIIEMTPNKKNFTYNGMEKSFDYLPEIVNSAIYISISDINIIDHNFYKIENEIGLDGEYRVLMRRNERSVEQKARAEKDYSFDLELLKQFRKDQNSVVSPISLKVALAMAANGTGGETQRQILNALNIKDLNAFNETVKNTVEKPYKSAQWISANSIWVNKQFLPKGEISWNNGFVNIVKENYDGISDSVKDSSDINKLNTWISDHTNGLITDSMKKSDFELMLMNVSYFKGSWLNPFYESETKPNRFFNKDGSQTITDFMSNTATNSYYEENGLKSLTLSYGDYGYEKTPYDMTFVMTEKELNSETLNRIFKYQDRSEVSVKLPIFKVENEEDCIKILKKLGINDLFNSSKADLTPMINELGYCVNKVVQNAIISIDEKGTEAAAMSSISVTRGILDKVPLEFIADHPFYYFIRNNHTGDILFEGYYSSAKWNFGSGIA